MLVKFCFLISISPNFIIVLSISINAAKNVYVFFNYNFPLSSIKFKDSKIVPDI